MSNNCKIFNPAMNITCKLLLPQILGIYWGYTVNCNIQGQKKERFDSFYYLMRNLINSVKVFNKQI